MSKNRNRSRLDKANNDREYNILQKGAVVYCRVCEKRAGRFGATCGPVRWAGRWRIGCKNPRKAIATWEARGFRTWKHNRDTQWRE